MNIYTYTTPSCIATSLSKLPELHERQHELLFTLIHWHYKTSWIISSATEGPRRPNTIHTRHRTFMTTADMHDERHQTFRHRVGESTPARENLYFRTTLLHMCWRTWVTKGKTPTRTTQDRLKSTHPLRKDIRVGGREAKCFSRLTDFREDTKFISALPRTLMGANYIFANAAAGNLVISVPWAF